MFRSLRGVLEWVQGKALSRGMGFQGSVYLDKGEEEGRKEHSHRIPRSSGVLKISRMMLEILLQKQNPATLSHSRPTGTSHQVLI